jgi:hypothetical protein
MLVAMALLAVGLSTVLALFTFGAALRRTSAERERAGLAAEALVAQLRDSLFPLESDGSAGDPPALVDQPVPNAPGLLYSVRLREDEEVPGAFFAEIEISWKERGRRRGERFETILVREVPFDRRVRALSREP